MVRRAVARPCWRALLLENWVCLFTRYSLRFARFYTSRNNCVYIWAIENYLAHFAFTLHSTHVDLSISQIAQASGPELVGGTSGESEERIRQIFESAASNAPSVLFIDAIDVIAGKKDVSYLQ